jgi:hypothetical protein
MGKAAYPILGLLEKSYYIIDPMPMMLSGSTNGAFLNYNVRPPR